MSSALVTAAMADLRTMLQEPSGLVQSVRVHKVCAPWVRSSVKGGERLGVEHECGHLGREGCFQLTFMSTEVQVSSIDDCVEGESSLGNTF